MSVGAVIDNVGSMKENKTGSWRSMRPVIDQEKCIKCKRCEIFCPEACIDVKDDTRIDMDYCKGCGICASVCAVKAIRMEEEK